MMALPVGFLPFDPNHDNRESDDEDEEEEEIYAESDEDNSHGSISNGENNHEQKQARHIGGGVVLVRKNFNISEIFSK
jgi:hypothetical protein